jgi:DNA mismatch repair protein MutL
VPRIRLLADTLVSQIAAGEVVERPSSVVKELVENALDAGARRVEVELEAGGKRRIVVLDDGCGMGRDDALLAFDRHATSKIEALGDLERIATLGFRGEALASIAAVAKVELITAEEPGDGHRVLIEGGRVRRAEPAPHPRGTRIEVRSLFFNVPARRHFLKQPRTELRRATEVIQGYVLARPDVHFVLRHEGRELLLAPPVDAGVEGRRERISQLFGPSLGRSLVPLASERAPGIGGFVGNRQTSRGARRLFVFVNRRLIRDRAVMGVFYRALRDEWKGEDVPALFLFLDLPSEEVDVNVHPQKAEVRFRDPALLQRLGAVLRQALARARGEEPAPLRQASAAPPGSPTLLSWEGLGGRAEAPAWRSVGGVGESQSRLAEIRYAPRPSLTRVPLSGRDRTGSETLRVLGQYKGPLILLEGPAGLYLIDQHVAHERILYERFRRALESERPAAQSLLEPQLLELAPAEADALAEMADDLEQCGFVVNRLSGHSLALTATPSVLAADQAERLILAVATRAADDGGGEGAEDLRRRLLDALAASQACRAAVKMHHPLTLEEMEELVSELFRAENPYACPHGRPVVLEMTDADLESRFGRR